MDGPLWSYSNSWCETDKSFLLALAGKGYAICKTATEILDAMTSLRLSDTISDEEFKHRFNFCNELEINFNMHMSIFDPTQNQRYASLHFNDISS